MAVAPPARELMVNMLERHRQLDSRVGETTTPKVTWISGLFNPQAFLTAVCR